MKPQPKVQRRQRPRTWMAYPPRQHADSAVSDAAWIAWGVLILLWIGAMSGGLAR
jgi:hypothetical protein